ncbi:MATE family efflux transporter [Endozoicomonadaceae bacterium StTr2]
MYKELKKIWDFSWPVTLANITVPMLGLVDAAVLGHLDSEIYLGGVAIGTTIFTTIMWAFGFLRMGTAGLVAREAGKGDQTAQVSILLNSLLLGLACALLLIPASYLLTDHMMGWFGASGAVSEQAAIYFQTRLIGSPAVLANYVILGWLLGMGKPRAPLILLVVANLLNIVLDLFFVLGLGMATRGAALASVIADWSTLLLGFWLVKEVFSNHRMAFNLSQHLRPAESWEMVRRVIRVNGHLFLRTLLVLFTFAFFTAKGAQLGDNTLAANALLLNLVMLVANGLDGLAFAAESLCGHALGQKNIASFRKTVALTGVMSWIGALLFTAGFVLGGPLLIAAMTDIETVRVEALAFLPWLQLMPLVAVTGYWLDGVFIGALRTDLMQHTMIFSVLLVFLPVWYFTQDMGNHGLWLAMITFMFGRSVSMLVTGRIVWRQPPVLH